MSHRKPAGRSFVLRLLRLPLAFFILIASSSLTHGQSQTSWNGITTDWRESSNWTSGVPTSLLSVLISNGEPSVRDAYVPAPLNDDTARTKNLIIQSEGILRFESGGFLIVYGTDKLQNDGFVYLGSGTILFVNNISFLNGGLFDAGNGTLQFQGVTWDNKSGSTFTPGTSTVVLQGSSDQSIIINDPSSDLQFYDLQILTQGTVTISGSVTVQHDCYIAEGCTLNVPLGSSFTVNGTFINDGVIIGEGSTSSPLPVQITSFSAAARGLAALLTWRTASEVNNYGFEIERREVESSESKVQGSKTLNQEQGTWNSVGFVRGSGTSTSPLEYSFSDKNLPPGRYAYRLKQIDFDGSAAYHDAVEIEIGLAPRSFSLGQNYPNPFNPMTTIEFTLPDNGRAILKVYNLVGQEVAVLFDAEAEAGRLYQRSFDASSLPSGLYFARLRFGDQTTIRRMTLIR